jgi:hypothetical protein
MPILLLSLIRFFRLLLSGHQAIALEHAALRVQLATFQRKRKRPLLAPLIECFGRSVPSLAQLAPPAALRSGRYRGALSASAFDASGPASFEPTAAAAAERALALKFAASSMASANPLWRTPRLHGELQMLGVQISERTVAPSSADSAARRLKPGRPFFTTT